MFRRSGSASADGGIPVTARRALPPIRTLTVGPGISPGQPAAGCGRVADCNRRFGIAPTPECAAAGTGSVCHARSWAKRASGCGVPHRRPRTHARPVARPGHRIADAPPCVGPVTLHPVPSHLFWHAGPRTRIPVTGGTGTRVRRVTDRLRRCPWGPDPEPPCAAVRRRSVRRARRCRVPARRAPDTRTGRRKGRVRGVPRAAIPAPSGVNGRPRPHRRPARPSRVGARPSRGKRRSRPRRTVQPPGANSSS